MSEKKRFFNTPAVSRTVLDSKKDKTALEKMIVRETRQRYRHTHAKLSSSRENSLIQESTDTDGCRHCGSDDIVSFGRTKNGNQRYCCRTCGRTFTKIKGTLFDSHKIRISEWVEFLADLCDFMSLNAISKNMRISMATAKYWLIKVFRALEHYQDGIVLGGDVVADECFLPESASGMKLHADGKKLRGLSGNLLCIYTGIDSSGSVICFFGGYGKPTKDGARKYYGSHITPGSRLIHDCEKSHEPLVAELNLKSQAIDSETAKKLPDEDNPLTPINEIHSLFSRFWTSHSGFSRDRIQDWLNLFAFIMNPPSDRMLKARNLLNLIFSYGGTCRYRNEFGKNRKKQP